MNASDRQRAHRQRHPERVRAAREAFAKRSPTQRYEANLRYREKHPDKVREWSRSWNKRNRGAIQRIQKAWAWTPRGMAGRLVTHAKVRARKLEVPFDLRPEDILFPLELGVCEATNLPFQKTEFQRNPFAPSLDRKEPALGYVRGNVQVVLWALNAMRGDWGDQILLQIADALRRAA